MPPSLQSVTWDLGLAATAGTQLVIPMTDVQGHLGGIAHYHWLRTSCLAGLFAVTT
jgi:hypothetical protein